MITSPAPTGANEEAGVITSPVSVLHSDIGGSMNDIISLMNLYKPSILHALQVICDADIIYTSTGHILIVVKPFKAMNNLYSDKTMYLYIHFGDSMSGNYDSSGSSSNNSPPRMIPHVYQMVDNYYRTMI